MVQGSVTLTGAFVAQGIIFTDVFIGLIVSAAMVIILTFYLYFEGSRPRLSRKRRMLWVLVHLPYMLSLIILFEGKFWPLHCALS